MRLIKHACRTLIKKGDKKILSVFGYNKPELSKVKLKCIKSNVNFGEKFEFNLTLHSKFKKDQPLLIDFVIYHKKKDGSLAPKVFKWTEKNLKSNGELKLEKKHPFKQVSTRVYYGGEHQIEILINGYPYEKQSFLLKK